MRFAAVALVLAGCSSAAVPAMTEKSAGETAPRPEKTIEKTTPHVEVAAAVMEPVSPEPALAPVEFEASWAGFGVANCSYLAPKDFVHDDGGVDVIWHFHAGQMATRDMKASNARAVFVSCGYGIGTGRYSSTFDDPNRFGAMMKSLVRTLARKSSGSRGSADGATRDVHLGHLALASWSAGFASVGRILAVPEWYAKTDAVLLFDSLHAQYIDSPEDAKLRSAGRPVAVAARGADHVDRKMLRHFIRFAADAAAGTKLMVITHSAIVPPDYASTSEATAALLDAIDVKPAVGASAASEFGLPGMHASVVADQGGLHVRGFRGEGPHDHFDHLHLIGDAVRTWLLPAWYSPVSERH